MFELIVALLFVFVIGLILGSLMPNVSEYAWGALMGLVGSYLFIYDNQYLWFAMAGSYSSRVIGQTRLLVTVIGFLVIGGITFLGVKLGQRRKEKADK